MSGECSLCGEHCLDCFCDKETQVGFLFSMPLDGTLEIRSSKPIDDLNVDGDQEIEGVVYHIYWNNQPLPWFTKTKMNACAIAFGCQWGAMQMEKTFRIDREICSDLKFLDDKDGGNRVEEYLKRCEIGEINNGMD